METTTPTPATPEGYAQHDLAWQNGPPGLGDHTWEREGCEACAAIAAIEAAAVARHVRDTGCEALTVERLAEAVYDVFGTHPGRWGDISEYQRSTYRENAGRIRAALNGGAR